MVLGSAYPECLALREFRTPDARLSMSCADGSCAAPGGQPRRSNASKWPWASIRIRSKSWKGWSRPMASWVTCSRCNGCTSAGWQVPRWTWTRVDATPPCGLACWAPWMPSGLRRPLRAPGDEGARRTALVSGCGPQGSAMTLCGSGFSRDRAWRSSRRDGRWHPAFAEMAQQWQWRRGEKG